MNTLQNMFQQAQLAEAAYADLTGIAGLTGSAIFEQRLQDEGMSKSQAADFVSHWQVVHHLPNTDSGFSGAADGALLIGGIPLLALYCTARDAAGKRCFPAGL